MVILNENSCHCNAMQCIFYEGDKLGADRPLPITVGGTLCMTPASQKGGKKNTLYINEESGMLLFPSAGTLLIVHVIDYFDAKKEHLKIKLTVSSFLY